MQTQLQTSCKQQKVYLSLPSTWSAGTVDISCAGRELGFSRCSRETTHTRAWSGSADSHTALNPAVRLFPADFQSSSCRWYRHRWCCVGGRRWRGTPGGLWRYSWPVSPCRSIDHSGTGCVGRNGGCWLIFPSPSAMCTCPQTGFLKVFKMFFQLHCVIDKWVYE